ncbi:MAG: hypothetical protein QM656_08390 [Paracoccaceae bacterium]
MLSVLARTFRLATRTEDRANRTPYPSQDWPGNQWDPNWPAPLHWYQRPRDPRD